MENWLFPENYTYSSAWSTSSLISNPNILNVEISLTDLGARRVDRRRPPCEVVPAPNISCPKPQKAWRAVYPEGSINPSGAIPGGFGYYLGGPKDFQEKLRTASEAIFGYSVLFQEEWEWVKGGKLPGAYGGVGTSAYSCTGGRKEGRDTCFNLRLMWRRDGLGELYAYLPVTEENTSQLLAVPPKSIRNPDYGISAGRGAFTFKAGVWTTITERVKLNDVGNCNGEIEVQINGEPVIHVTGLVIRLSEDSVIQGLHFESFFGGHTADWASPKNQYAWFADISGAVIV
ncbi:hypothetical protein ACEPAF_6129 [Sanghuangporus sanghuang]